MELKVLAAFCIVLLSCIILDFPLLLALVLGLAIFLGYGLWRKYALGVLCKMCWESIFTVRNILITFMLIGMLTATWRACGTIPVIITLAADFINPASFIMTTFLLNALISFLIGTSFGTVATMGVICMSIAQTLQLDTFWVAGAVISGIYFGDRCSPVSTSALLVSTLTETDLYQNIKMMFKTCSVPFVLTCAIYFAVGKMHAAAAVTVDVRSIFASSFDMSVVCVLPAVVILGLSLLKVNVKKTMSVSIVIAVALGMSLQHINIVDIGKILVLGYSAPTEQLAKMLNGGGMLSMVKVFCIVCLASCYSGIFKGTGLLDNVQAEILTLQAKLGTFVAILLTAIVTGMIACNQTLNIMLTHQLCSKMPLSKAELAIDLEDTAVLVSPMIPWNIAVAVPLATINAPAAAILAACYLYLVPLYRVVYPGSCPVKEDGND